MKVVKSRKISDRIEKEMAKVGIESFLNTAVILPVTQNEVVFKERGKLLDAAADFQKQMRAQGLIYSEDESLIGAMLVAMFNEKGNLNEQSPLFLNLLIKNSFVFHRDEIEENPYYQTIQFEDVQAGKYTLGHNTYQKYELFQCDLVEVAGMVHIPRLATFDHRFKYPSIMENDETWMSVTPGELKTMEEPILHAKGKVLTLGLGMGYYAFMVSEKEDVEQVTIVEQSEEVISLFKQYILPQFPHKEKITIIKADAIEYLKELPDATYDYCFADIWIGTMDYVPYLRMRSVAKKFTRMQMEYWIQDALDFTVGMSVFKLILSTHDGMADTEKYLEELTEEERYLDQLLKDVTIQTPEELEHYLKSESVIELISQ